MNKREKIIKTVHTAVCEEIKSYISVYGNTDGLLEYLQNHDFKIGLNEVFEVYGINHLHFDIFDTQEHLDEFIKEYNLLNDTCK